LYLGLFLHRIKGVINDLPVVNPYSCFLNKIIIIIAALINHMGERSKVSYQLVFNRSDLQRVGNYGALYT
jgi:hypothetical protein